MDGSRVPTSLELATVDDSQKEKVPILPGLLPCARQRNILAQADVVTQAQERSIS